MNFNYRRAIMLLATFACLCSERLLLAQIGNLVNANAQAYYGDASDTFKARDPLSIPLWGGSAGPGPYSPLGVPTVPSPPAAPLFPATLPTSNSFAGSPYFTAFANVANSISGIATFGSGGTAVSDAQVLTKFNFNNQSTQYAYHQWDFEVDYFASGVLAGGIGSSPTLYISGSTVGALSYAQFAGTVNYWLTPTNTAGMITGPAVNLGAITYNWSAIGPGVYTAIPVTPTGALAATTSSGYLSLVGTFFAAGDPAEFTVVPEPSTWVIGGLGMLGLVINAYRRKRTVAVNIV